MNATDVLDYWSQIGNKGWWVKNPQVDAEIHAKFGKLHADACQGKLDEWADTPDGALALIIVLDQFSRNMFRSDSRCFTHDAKSLEIAKTALEKGFDKKAQEDLRFFFYLPFEHSENIEDQNKSVELFEAYNGSPDFMKAALEHQDIIARFGRFPHRNKMLGRETTPEEQAYLDGDGFKG